MKTVHPSSENYLSLLENLHALWLAAGKLPLKRLPDRDTPLSDAVILELLADVAQAGGFGNPDLQDFPVDESQWWLVDLAMGKLSREDACRHVLDDIAASGGECLSGIRVWPEAMHDDWLTEILDSGDIPLEFSLFGDYYLDPIVISQKALMAGCFGGGGVVGTAAVAISTLRNDYAADVHRWDTPAKALRGMRKIPLMASLAWMHWVPGLERNIFLGATTWSPEEPGIHFMWQEAGQIAQDKAVAQSVAALTPDISKKDPAWLFEQVLLAFNFREPAHP